MPELPEVERARRLIQDQCTGYKIKSVEAFEDKIVYTGGTDHEAFTKELEGRTVTGCERKGKMFWMTLDGEGRYPLMHFGMTGALVVKGQTPFWYRRRVKESDMIWPPRFVKFILELEPQPGSVSQEPVYLAFVDGRRLARIRLVPDPVLSHAPASQLGFDPLLSHPTLEEFQDLISKKKGTIKGLIMNQAFSAGVGNWVADEVLYQARIHPSAPVPALSAKNVVDLHHWLNKVCQVAVDVNADSLQFPPDWLFRWRWGKGKKQAKGKKAAESDDEVGDVKPEGMSFLALPDGKPATILFTEVGGRTTAYVKELQQMPEGVEIKPKITKGGKGSKTKKAKKESDSESELSEMSDSEEEEKVEATPRSAKSTPRRKAAVAAAKLVKEEDEEDEEVEVSPTKVKRKVATVKVEKTVRQVKRRVAKKEE